MSYLQMSEDKAVDDFAEALESRRTQEQTDLATRICNMLVSGMKWSWAERDHIATMIQQEVERATAALRERIKELERGHL